MEAVIRRLPSLAFVLLLGSFLSPPSLGAQQPTILHVNRADSTCGGQSPCFATIQAAISTADPNSIIRIQAGTYPEQLSITRKNNFQGATEIDRIVIEADPATQPGQVVLTGAPRACAGNYAIRLQQSKFITIRGLTITGDVDKVEALINLLKPLGIKELIRTGRIAISRETTRPPRRAANPRC